ncbi:MAG: 2-dehydro-3-deoxyphosphooctonate aldolase [Flavobacteriaceae bacterium]|nr:2-dehydro-3-deoxyphosphooctonate aldolase [Flavobacteriaceae bacterium]
MKKILYIFAVLVITSCTSTKSTLKNVDETATKPKVVNKAFVFTEHANDMKYGYDADYPINIGLMLERQESIYISYFFNGLLGPNNEPIEKYEKIDTCCPFPTTHNTMGAGTLGIYEVTFKNNPKKVKLHFNIYEKGKILCPKGFNIKPITEIEK